VPTPNPEPDPLGQQVAFLLGKLSSRMQPVFTAWMKAQTRGALEDCSPAGITAWLANLDPGQAAAQEQLMVMEIAWLEYLSREFQILFEEDLS